MDSSPSASVSVSLVIPTYNEAENIEILVSRVYQALEKTGRTFEIIIVDDDSPDETWKIAQSFSANYPNQRVIRRINEKGLARAVVRGWELARGEVLAVMDGDLQHPPEVLPLLIRVIDSGTDIAVASRHVRGGGVSNWKLVRRAISWGAGLIATWFLPGVLQKVLDPMSGFFALRKSVIEGTQLNPEGYKILLEVLCRGHYRGVAEVPYTFVERARGGSKLGFRQYLEFGMHLLRLSHDTGELRTFLRYCLVGVTGVFVNSAALITAIAAGMDYTTSSILAVELAILTNGVLNEFWTFKSISKERANTSARLNRFLQFNSFCAGGALINLGISRSLITYGDFHYFLGSMVGILAGTFWNYGMNANMTWTREQPIDGYVEPVTHELIVTEEHI
jgi:dolichol-phosphate mannosyltransferase